MIKSKDIKIVKIEELKPNPKNKNKHPEKQLDVLCKIIKAQGFRDPIVVSNRSGFVVSGHARLEAAKMAGFKEVPVSYQDFDNEEQEYKHLIAANEIARYAEFDKDGFAQDLKDFKIEDPDFEEFGILNWENIEKESKESSEIDINFEYKLEIDCGTEDAQQMLQGELNDRGFKVRVLI